MYTYKYPRPALTADIVLLDAERREVLLIKRGNEPFRDCWAFPGGFFDMDDETIEATARRELKEETGVEDVKLEELCTASKKGRDPRGRTVTVVFVALVDRTKINAKGSDDAKEARWFGLDELPQLAFDHAEILQKAIKKYL
ncbi:MAG: NUDIX hydrolase [Bacteroidales bacterium]|nr:NUDIX hydrolase [Bacteroidales bacterium]